MCVSLTFSNQDCVCVCVFRSIKHYFLMDKGDFFVHFMDLTEEELKKPVDDIIPPRLEALLELALRTSTANTDPFKDDLKVLTLRICHCLKLFFNPIYSNVILGATALSLRAPHICKCLFTRRCVKLFSSSVSIEKIKMDEMFMLLCRST